MIDTTVLQKIKYGKNQKYNPKTKFGRKPLFYFEYKFVSEKNRGVFLIKDVLNLLKWVNGLKSKVNNAKTTVFLNLDKAEPVDNLTITFLEYVCYYIISNLEFKLFVSINFEKRVAMLTSKDTLLRYLVSLTPDTQRYRFEYEKQYSIYMLSEEVYKRAFDAKNIKVDIAFHSKLNQEIYQYFGNNTSLNITQSLDLAETITELVENAIEHTKTDCYLTIYSPVNEVKARNSDNAYHVLDVSLFNISDKYMGDDVLQKIENGDIEGELKPVFQHVVEAYTNHSRNFTEKYDRESFGILSAMQYNVTGRFGDQNDGGTGVPKMIMSLQKSSYLDGCYLISGHKGFQLMENYLGEDSDGYVGMNDNNYVNQIPNEETLLKLSTEFPGTAYHLSFVFEKGIEYGNY
ncbi:MAG: hypothetical protein ACLT1L_03190 [Leuconostoc lactis]|uniref:hypothetical protein n=1 Tax=Leuconostoc lactis TaxID=1246 RepID=UPI0039919027